MRKEVTPVRARVKSEISKLIISREFKKGDRLPPERLLAERLKVSRLTVAQALNELEEEGVISKLRGSGSYINTDPIGARHEDLFAQIATRTEVEISFGSYNPTPQYELLLKTLAGLFQIENPSIKVRIQAIHPPANENADAFLLLIGGGKPPTVGEFFLHAEYSAIDSLVPLEKLPGYDELTGWLLPQCACKTKNSSGKEHVHALALKINSRVVLVNADFMSAAGIDCDVDRLSFGLLEEWSSKLGSHVQRNPGSYGVLLDTPSGWHGVIGNYPYLWGHRPSGLENSLEGFKTMLSSPRCRHGLELLARVRENGVPAPFERLELFACGQVGMLLSGGTWPLELNDLMRRKFAMRAFQIPSYDGRHTASAVMGNFSVGIFRSGVRDDRELDAAWKWLKFLFRKRQQYAISFDYNFPAVKDLPCVLKERHPSLSQVFERSLQASLPQFDFKNLRWALSILGEEMKRRFSGEASSEECLSKAISKIEAIRNCE